MQEINQLLDIMKQIRKQCPWDAKQTHESLKRYLIEETYEVVESIDHEDYQDLKNELGDLLLQIVFHSELASEKGLFSFKDVVKTISKKMIERHPHVFEQNGKISAEEVQANWEKNKHRSEKRTSLLSGIPAHLPGLLKAQRLQDKAASVGFDWDTTEQVVEKLDEEIKEFKDALKTKDKTHIKNEMGDLFFTLVNMARFLNIIAEETIQQSNTKFVNRFNYIENHFDNDPEKLANSELKEMDALWNKAKEAD